MHDIDMRVEALKWIEAGKPIFPCNPSTKAPLIEGGFKSASIDREQIEAWWSQHPAASIGMPTGQASGFWVLDVDEPSLFEAKCRLPLPETRKVRTGKGYHLFFTFAPSCLVRNAQRNAKTGWPFPELPGAEVRGDGGYVIVPPSLHPGGKRYEFANDCAAVEAPSELLAIICRDLPRAGEEHERELSLHRQHVDTAYGLAALDSECNAVRTACDGAQEAALNSAALKIGALVAGAELSLETAKRSLVSAGLAMPNHAPSNPWTVKCVTEKVERGLSHGSTSPRVAPNSCRETSTNELRDPPARGAESQTPPGLNPIPLLRPIPTGAPYPIEALGPLRAAVEAVQARTKAPVALAAQSALSIAALAVQGFANVETLGGHSPLSIFALSIALSGERKSSVDSLLIAAVRDYEKRAIKEFERANAKWSDAHDGWEAARRTVQRSIEKGDATGADLEKIGPAPKRPRNPDRLVTEPTFEGLARLFNEGQPSLGLFSDEGGQFLGGHAMNRDNRLKTMGAFNALWGGDPIKRTRAGEGAYTIPDRRLSLHLMMQPGSVAQSLLADQLASDSGFLARCLICQPPSCIGSRYETGEPFDIGPVDRFKAALDKILSLAMPVDDETGGVNVRLLSLTAEAKALLVQYNNDVEAAQRPGDKYETITSHASKSAEHAVRIAGVLTLFTDIFARTVSAEAMTNGIVLARYYVNEALRLVDNAAISAAVRDAEKLRTWMLSPSWGKPHLTIRDVSQLGPNSLRESVTARKAVKLLEEHHWLVPIAGGAIIDGRRTREVWRVVRD